jgi:hypothetical protein
MPALDPSYAWNSTGESGPAIASNTCASAMYIPSVYRRFGEHYSFYLYLDVSPSRHNKKNKIQSRCRCQ